MEISIEQQIANAENELQAMLANINTVNDCILVIDKEWAHIDLAISKLRQEKLVRKAEHMALSDAITKQRNNISIKRSEIKNLTQEYWNNKNK